MVTGLAEKAAATLAAIASSEGEGGEATSAAGGGAAVSVGLSAGVRESPCHTTAAMVRAPIMAMMIPTMKMSSISLR
jgi:hypothetical protein